MSFEFLIENKKTLSLKIPITPLMSKNEEQKMIFYYFQFTNISAVIRKYNKKFATTLYIIIYTLRCNSKPVVSFKEY